MADLDTAALAGRHALVTGGGRGIGAAIGAALAARGAAVTLLGRNAASLMAQSDRCGSRTGFVIADVTSSEALELALGTAATARGPIDILINNAGIAPSTPFLRTSAEVWREVLAVDLLAVVEACRLVLPGMVERRWGRIVTIASTAALKGYAYVSAYCAAKHAVLGLTRALALETAKQGVTVNAVCPGFTDTDLVARAVEVIVERTGRDAAAARAELAGGNPQGRLVRAEEVADAVLWLCGPGAGAVTGQAITVAGGEVM